MTYGPPVGQDCTERMELALPWHVPSIDELRPHLPQGCGGGLVGGWAIKCRSPFKSADADETEAGLTQSELRKGQ